MKTLLIAISLLCLLLMGSCGDPDYPQGKYPCSSQIAGCAE